MAPAGGRRDVLIVSRSGDLHARLLLAEIRDLGGQPDMVVADDLVDGGARWSTAGLGSIRAADELEVRPEEYGALWWRRGAISQRASSALDHPVHRAMVDAAWRDFLVGLCATRFAGTWVSRPELTARAENKIVQLTAARDAGLLVPLTVITQDPAEVRALWQATSGRLVVKSLRNAGGFTYPTRHLAAEDLDRSESIRLAPAIYQEEVPGVSHLRAHWLGTRFLTFRIRSNALDWRGDLGVPMEVATLARDTEDQLTRMLLRLGLAFGVCDLKEAPDGGVYFLEVNPQGQFAFWDGLVPGAHVCTAVAGYLLALARGEVMLPTTAEVQGQRPTPVRTTLDAASA